MCNTCTAKKLEPPSNKTTQHTYLHVLVRCKQQRTECELLADNATKSLLEQEVGRLRLKVEEHDSKMLSIEASLGRLEQMLGTVLLKMDSMSSVH